MSRGLGRVQLTILAILAQSGYAAGWDERMYGLLVEEIAQRFPAPRMNSAGRSSIRRALGTMHSAGLVQARYWRPRDRGQPQLWMITNDGMVAWERWTLGDPPVSRPTSPSPPNSFADTDPWSTDTDPWSDSGGSHDYSDEPPF